MALTQEQVTLISVAAFGVAPGEVHSKYFLDSDAAGKFFIGETGKQIHEVLGLKEPLTGTAAVAAVLEHEYNHLVSINGLEKVSNAEFVKNVAKNLGAEDSKTLAVDLASGMSRYDALAKFAQAEADKAGGIENVAGIITAQESDKTIDNAVKDLVDSAVKPDTPNKPEVDGEEIFLTEGRDNKTGTADNDLFIANVGQNQNGAIANELSTGDRLDGGAGRDTLEATLIQDNEVDSSTNQAPRPITKNIEVVKIEALESVTLDATRMKNVEEYWSNFSRGDMTFDNVNLRGDNLNLTKDVTFGLRDAESDAGLTGRFETQALTREAQTASNSQLRINLMDLGTEASPYDANAPLGQLAVNGFRFTVDGVTKEIASGAIDDASTYAELFAAVQAALAKAAATDPSLEGLEVSIEENAFNTAPSVALLPNGNAAAQTGDSIVIRDAGGRELAGQGFIQEGDTTEFTLFGRFSTEAPKFNDTQIESNLILDNAGRGSTAGDVGIGGSSNSGQGIEKLKLVVDRDSAIASLNVAGKTQAQGTRDLQEIELTSKGDEGSLRINNIEDVQIFNATAFEGENLTLKNVDLLDAESHFYNTGSSNSTMTFDIVGEPNIDNDGNRVSYGDSYGNLASDANFSLNVTTGSGSDTIVVNTAGDGGLGNNGTASQFNDHVNAKNVNISTGGGADTVITQGYGAASIKTGGGNDWVRTDNSGTFAKFLLNGDPAASGVAPDQWADSLVGGGDTAFNMFKTKVQVEFLGVKSDWIEIVSNNYRTSASQINDAIKKAIDTDNELSKLLEYEDTRNEGLVIESLVDRLLATDGSDFNISFLAPRMSDGTNAEVISDNYDEQSVVSNGELQDAWETYVNSTWGDGSNAVVTSPFDGLSTEGDVLNVIDGIATGLSTGDYVTDGAHQDNGTNSTALTHNVVNAGAGDDVIVLSSNVNGGFDTVVFEGNFGHDTIVNFNTDTLGGTSRDVLDFTSHYLDKVANGRGDSANSKTNIVDQSVQYTYVGSGVSPSVAGSGGFAYHNTISQVDLSDLWANIGTNKPGNFYGLTQAQVKAALEASNTTSGYTQANVGMTSVLLVAKDQEINEDGTLGATVGNKDEAIVYVVRVASVDTTTGKVTFEVAEKGSFQLAKAFSDLDDLSAGDFAGTAAWAVESKAIEKAIKEEAGVSVPTEAPSEEPIDPVEEAAVVGADGIANVNFEGTEAADVFTVTLDETAASLDLGQITITDFGANDQLVLDKVYDGGFGLQVDLGGGVSLDNPVIAESNSEGNLELTLMKAIDVENADIDVWTITFENADETIIEKALAGDFADWLLF